MKRFEFYILWWSAGITSAVACYYAIQMYGKENVKIFYIETGSAHEDNARFKKECEQWYGMEITTVRNSKGYISVSDVIRKTGYVNGPDGARCTLELKKNVRYELQKYYTEDLFQKEVCIGQVFGFEYSKKEINRAIRFLQQYDVNARMPLIEKGISKNASAAIIIKQGIQLPAMYEYFNNNNCKGCTKGGMGYWNKVREVDYGTFKERAADERFVGHSCIKGVFLDELPLNAGRHSKIVVPECGTFCDIEFADIPDKNLAAVMKKEMTIYEAAKAA